MNLLKKEDNKYIRSRTKGVITSAQSKFDRMYFERGNKGVRIKLSPYVTFERASK